MYFIPPKIVLSLMHVVGDLQNKIHILNLECRAYYSSNDNNFLHGNPIPNKIYNLSFPKGFTMPNFSIFDGMGNPYLHLKNFQLSMASFSNDRLLLKAFPSSLIDISS